MRKEKNTISGRWAVDSGQWPVASGQWSVVSLVNRNLLLKNFHEIASGINRSHAIHPSSFRAAVTLVEMLVVLVIVALLAAASLQALPNDDSRVREAARMVNVYISSARSRAMETGRPAGVIFQRFSNVPNACTIMQQCEEPPPYGGEMTGSLAEVFDCNYVGPLIVLAVRFRMTDYPANNKISVGDLMQINLQGPKYTVVDPSDGTISAPTSFTKYILDTTTNKFNFSSSVTPNDSDGDGWIDNYCLMLKIDKSHLPVSPWPTAGWSLPQAYTIFRAPIKSSARPLQLPGGTVVDLAFSGTDTAAYFDMNASNSIRVMFSPNGSLDKVYTGTGAGTSITTPLYFLMGKLDRVIRSDNLADLTNETNPDFLEPKSIWVTIQPQTGVVSTVEMNPVSSVTPAQVRAGTWPSSATDAWTALTESRNFARQDAETMGGR